MTTFNEDLQKDWQDLYYIVDVEVVTTKDKISNYKILKLYNEETFFT